MKWTRLIALAALITLSSMASKSDYIVTGTNEHRILEHIITNEVCAREFTSVDEATSAFKLVNDKLISLATSYIPSSSAVTLARMDMAKEETKDIVPRFELKLSKAIEELKTARNKNQHNIKHELQRVKNYREALATIKEQDSPQNKAKAKAIRDKLEKVIKVEKAKRDAIVNPVMAVRSQVLDALNSSKLLATKCRTTYMKNNNLVIVK